MQLYTMKVDTALNDSSSCTAFSPSTFDASTQHANDVTSDLLLHSNTSCQIPNMETNNNMTTMVKTCSGCQQSILDRFLLHAMDKFWHTGCLKCECCHAQLAEIGASCFLKSGMVLCRNDYIRLFGNTGTCTGCKQSIPAQELVMRAQAQVYHVDCFSCVICRIRLCRGDRYTLYQGQLLCEHDFPKVMKGTITMPYSSAHRTSNKLYIKG